MTSWDEQAALFALAHAAFGRVDVAVANAGIGDTAQGQFVQDELQKPDLRTVDVDTVGVVYSALPESRTCRCRLMCA